MAKQNHVLSAMIYSNAMMYWIASHAHADAVLAIQIISIKNDRVDLTAQLSSVPDLQAGGEAFKGKCSRRELRSANYAHGGTN